MEVKHAEFTRILETKAALKREDIRLSWILPMGKVRTLLQSKWVVGVAHLPVAALWKEIPTIPIGQNSGQMKKSVLVETE